MLQNQIDSFPPEVIEKLRFYVYRLIDPRTGETFYVGKGKGNRVFQHARAAAHIEPGGTARAADGEDDDETSQKLQLIREIRQAGLDVSHVIHRHGMDEATAFQVEAVLMDAYPGIHNIASGTDSSDYGSMHAMDLYHATRFAWKISSKMANQSDVTLPAGKADIKRSLHRRGVAARDRSFPRQAGQVRSNGIQRQRSIGRHHSKIRRQTHPRALLAKRGG